MLSYAALHFQRGVNAIPQTASQKGRVTINRVCGCAGHGPRMGNWLMGGELIRIGEARSPR
jgi:hypothetical protein